MPSKFTAVRAFRLVDPRTGEPTDYAPGDVFDGPTDKNPYLLDPAGPDGCGPLITDKPPVKSASDKSAPEKSVSDSKEN